MEVSVTDDLPVGTSPLTPNKIDLNWAAQSDLEELPGIGPALAQRILAFREEHGPFASPEDVMQVEGIGPVTYARFADRLVAWPLESAAAPEHLGSPDETPPPLPADPEQETVAVLMEAPSAEAELYPEILPPPLPELELVPAFLPPPLPEPDHDAELLAPEPQHTPEADLQPEALISLPTAEGKPAPALELEQPAGPSTVQPAAASRQAPPQKKRRLDWLWGGLLGGFLGTVFGMLFTLLVLYSINGALSVEHSRAFVELRGQSEALDARLDRTEAGVEELKRQMEALAGLPARVKAAEEGLADLRTEMQTMGAALSRLETRVEDMGDDLTALQSAFATVQSQMESTMEFFKRLQTLLQQMFGEMEGSNAAPQFRVIPAQGEALT